MAANGSGAVGKRKRSFQTTIKPATMIVGVHSLCIVGLCGANNSGGSRLNNTTRNGGEIFFRETIVLGKELRTHHSSIARASGAVGERWQLGHSVAAHGIGETSASGVG
jgi:hypothetical protein